VPTVSPEHWGLTTNFERNRDCTSALTLTRYLLRAAAEGARTLGTDRQEAATWQAASERLAPYPTVATTNGPVWVDVAGAPPIEYNVPVPLSPVFWGDDVGPDSPTETWALARRTLEQIRIWQPHRGYLDLTIRPRLGLLSTGANLGVDFFFSRIKRSGFSRPCRRIRNWRSKTSLPRADSACRRNAGTARSATCASAASLAAYAGWSTPGPAARSPWLIGVEGESLQPPGRRGSSNFPRAPARCIVSIPKAGFIL
jgi:hypothetical protein